MQFSNPSGLSAPAKAQALNLTCWKLSAHLQTQDFSSRAKCGEGSCIKIQRPSLAQPGAKKTFANLRTQYFSFLAKRGKRSCIKIQQARLAKPGAKKTSPG